jgi:hypothetical protein
VLGGGTTVDRALGRDDAAGRRRRPSAARIARRDRADAAAPDDAFEEDDVRVLGPTALAIALRRGAMSSAQWSRRAAPFAADDLRIAAGVGAGRLDGARERGPGHAPRRGGPAPLGVRVDDVARAPHAA